jgi:hypothetical protein
MDWPGDCYCGAVPARDACNPWYRPSATVFPGVKVHRPEGRGNFCQASQEHQPPPRLAWHASLAASGLSRDPTLGKVELPSIAPGRAHAGWSSRHHPVPDKGPGYCTQWMCSRACRLAVGWSKMGNAFADTGAHQPIRVADRFLPSRRSGGPELHRSAAPHLSAGRA